MYADSISLWKESGPLLKSDPILTLETMFDPYFMALSCALAWLSICRSQTCHNQTVYHHLEIYLHDKPLSRCCRECMVDPHQDIKYGQIATIQIPKAVSIWLSSIVSQFHHVVSSSLYILYHHDMMQRLRLIMVDYALFISFLKKT